MSILNGNISYGAIRPEPSPFGRRLSAEKTISLPGCLSLTFDDARAFCFALSSRGLVVFDARDKDDPREIASLELVKGGRSIVYAKGYLYIAARDYGLYIVDVREPASPCLAALYDTLELATSVAVSGDLCLVANRHLGVELVDISVPSAPRFLSSYLCGEAQCVSIAGDLALVGDWMNRRVHVTDISCPSEPRTLSVFEVDGYADGVVYENGICYVATGHHSARLKNRYAYDETPFVTAEMLASGYGCGHGLEIFDLHDPTMPEYLSSVKLPPCFGAPDLWKVSVAAGRAYVSDSSNGLFIVNVEDRLCPFIEAHLRDVPKGVGYVFRQQVQTRCAPITDCFVLDGLLYLSGSESGILILPYAAAKDETKTIYRAKNNAISAEQVLSLDGQAHNLAVFGDLLLIASGSAGLYACTKDYRIASTLPTLALDVAVRGDRIFVAEGQGGVGCYTYGEGGFRRLSSLLIEEGSRSVRQVVSISDESIVLQLGARMLAFVKVAPDGSLTLETSFPVAGMIYYRNLTEQAFGGYFAHSSLREGVSLVSLETLKSVPALSLGFESCPLEDGISVDGRGAAVISKGRYAFVTSPEEMPSPDFLPSDDLFRGIPHLLGDKLLLLRRTVGEAILYDLKDPKTPVYLGTAKIPYPSSAIRLENEILVSAGHSGVWKISLP